LKDVTEATFSDIITPARTQFVVPIWQRTYSWEDQQWNDLWGDLLDLYERTHRGEQAQHFMGPIVVKTAEHKVGGITRWVIIDGQQRLTTMLLLCALIRDTAKIIGNVDLVSEIEGQFLYNQYARKAEDRPKLRPTEGDSKFFDQIANGQGAATLNENSLLHNAYSHFSDFFENDKSKFEIEGMFECIRALKLVTIRLEETDNPNRIFETLNFRGKDLAQSDLIRNFFMMSIRDSAKADETYAQIWFPMQQALGGDTLERAKNLETYLRHYSVMKNQEFVKEDRVYFRIREPLKNSKEDEVIAELKTIGEYSKFYEKLLFPNREKNLDLKRGFERLNRLKIYVHYPFTLKVYKGFASGKIHIDDFIAILRTLESFLVRRILARAPTHSLNRYFADLCKLQEENISHSFDVELASKKEWTAQYWPSDSDFIEQFLRLPIYKLSMEKCRFVLESLEESLKHPEPVRLDNLEIEHIMPETLNDDWKSYLGKEWKNIHDDYLHTFGNLTLIAPLPNESIKNKLFQDKKNEWYSKSNIGLTKELNEKWSEWKHGQISERAKMLAARAVSIWPRPEQT
jgi:uncharacterized protein with ParB-like and HNH nuclease domain